jgi:uncharacterized membrane protein YgdD (TMEM256/DUF423 family)
MRSAPGSARAAGVAGSLLAALAVLAGAFAAHALRDALSADAMATWRTAVDYQFVHAFALIALALMSPTAARARKMAFAGFVAGSILFCGSLYALALGAPRGIGLMTPLGGLAFVLGWVAMGRAFWAVDRHRADREWGT